MTTVAASDIAVELRRRLPGLGVKKLHKLLYYCQGHHLAATGRPLFSDSIVAFDMGPVVSRLWYAVGHSTFLASSVELDEGHLNTIGYVLHRYGGLTGTDLQHLTHQELPYLEADARRRPGTSAHIQEARWLRTSAARPSTMATTALWLLIGRS